MRNKQHFIAGILLLVFMAMQSLWLHKYSHSDKSHSCDICLMASVNQQLDFHITPSIALPIPVILQISIDQTVNYYAFAEAEYQQFSHYTRPPPVL